ncbi:DUF7848 domain-containing protein [Streptomyces sp. NPDC002758]
MTRSLFRHVDHAIGLDPHAERDMEDLECTSCDWKVGGLPFADLQEQAIKHAGAEKHYGFRQITTNYWRVVRHDEDLATQLSVPVATGGEVEPPEQA